MADNVVVKTHFSTTADEDPAVAVKTSGSGRLFYVHAINPNAADAYLQLFDLPVASVTVGTTTPKQSFLIPAGGGNAGAYESAWKNPIPFNNAITYAVTTSATGSGAPTSDIILNIHYD